VGLFVDANDSRETLIRTWFDRFFDREPSGAELQARMAELANGGRVATMFAELRDSPEAQAFRAKRGW